MADVAAAAGAAVAPAAPGAPAPAAAPGLSGAFGTIARMALVWYVMSWMRGGAKAPTPGSPAAVAVVSDALLPHFGKGVSFDVHAYLSERPAWEGQGYDPEELVWSVSNVPFATGEINTKSIPYFPSEAVRQNNASVYLHVVFVKTGSPMDPTDPDYQPDNVFRASHSLVKFMAKPKKKVGHNLLGGTKSNNSRSLLPWLNKANDTDSDSNAVAEIPLTSEELAIQEEEAKVFVGWFKPNITIAMVDHWQAYKRSAIPPNVGPFLRYTTLESGETRYDPIVHFDEFWLLRDKHVQLNDTVTNVTLHLQLSPMSTPWWQIMHQMDQSFAMQVDMGMSKDGESEELKRVLLEGNPILLAITCFVSLLHTVFDMLAFRNDIGFWKNNKSMEGLSARSVIINACCQLVILLYLVDNETSYVILFSSFLGTAIEFWKVTKAMKVEFLPAYPFVKVGDRASYVDTPTKQYDKEAMTYLGWVMYPLLVGYCIYTLLYQSHKSWYSWVVGSCVGAVYMFGFILMCPQLYLNYKLKSVAHLPWRQMTYKFLNTIIDDLFAFVIKMPTLHRLSVFRDDLVFAIFIYQRWIYRVDSTRVNEFGYSGQTDAEVEAANAAVAAAPAAELTAGDGTPAATPEAAAPQLLKDGAAAKSGTADVAKATGKGAKKDK